MGKWEFIAATRFSVGGGNLVSPSGSVGASAALPQRSPPETRTAPKRWIMRKGGIMMLFTPGAGRRIAAPYGVVANIPMPSFVKGVTVMNKKHIVKKLALCLAAVVLIFIAVVFCDSQAYGGHKAPRRQDDWRLTLVNENYAVPEGYAPPLLTLTNGEQVDERVYPDLQRMFDDARAAGLSLFVREGYRTRAEQTRIMEDRVNELLRAGWPEKQAREEAARTAARPGHSEHELGLAVDINSHTAEDEWRLYGWLAENAWRYGFLLRYPQDGEEITGITYEPWHYRYVGTDAAREIHEQGCTLEEYLCR